MKSKKVKNIEADTGIVPLAVAELAVETAFKLLDERPSDRMFGYYAGRLVENSEERYARDARFRAKVRSEKNGGNFGRDYLCGFMQHWTAAMLLEEGYNRSDWRRALVDSGFSSGRDCT